MRDIEVEFVPAAPRVAVDKAIAPRIPFAAYIIPILFALVLAVPVSMISSLANIGAAGVVMVSMVFGGFGFLGGLIIAAMVFGGQTSSGSREIVRLT